MHKKLWISIVTAMIGVGLLVAASFAGTASSASQSKGSASKVGGTLRVNLSTTDLQYTDPALEYESTGWQVEYATGLKLLNWQEKKASLFPEAAAAFPRVAAGGRKYTFTIRKGLRLSNGEAITAANFKLAFARAIEKDPDVWILDEATANVDSDTEIRFGRALDRATAGKTLVMIAHRLATIRKSDRILVLHKGNLVEQGDHQLVDRQWIVVRSPEVQQPVYAHVHARCDRLRDALEGRMPRWHGGRAQLLEQGHARRDDDAFMPAARDVTVGVVLPCTNEQHARRIHEHGLGSEMPLERARVWEDKLVFSRAPARCRGVARCTELLDTSEPARMQGPAANADRGRDGGRSRTDARRSDGAHPGWLRTVRSSMRPFGVRCTDPMCVVHPS